MKIYGQMASIMPFEVLDWEKLFWFLKFLVPKLKIKDPDQDALDELLESVDLSSYGLAADEAGPDIGLDASESPNSSRKTPIPGGYRDGEPKKTRWRRSSAASTSAGSRAGAPRPEEQRVKFLNIVESVQAHPDFEEKFSENPDPFSRDLAFDKIMKEVMLRRRKEELELYKLHSQDDAFRAALYHSVQKVLSGYPSGHAEP